MSNLALLGNKCGGCLVGRLYKARYFPKCDVLEMKKKEQLKFCVEEYL